MKKISILLLLFALIGVLAADVYTIGTGTSTQSYIPFYGLYDYGWSKVIFTAAELSAAGVEAGQIDGIGFEVGNTPSNYVSVDQRVYLRHTTAGEYADVDNTYPDNTLFQNVYYADYTWNGGGWHNVVFSTPFIWDGTSNIEILWENWDGDYASGPNFRYTTTSPLYQAVYKYADGSFPTTAGTRTYSRPNLRVLTPDNDPPNPAVVLNPADMSTAFGTSVTLSWSAGTGPIATGYNLYFGDTNPPAFVGDIGPVTSHTVSDLDYGTMYYWQVVPYNAIGSATDCPVWSFYTPGENQLVESFEATTFPPLGWANGTTGTWSRSTSTPLFHGSAHTYKYTSTSTAYQLSTPMVTVTEESELSFWTRATNTSQVLQIVYSEDRTTWTQVGADITYPATGIWYNQIIDLSSLAGRSYYLAFQTPIQTSTGSIYVDAVIGPDITPLAPGAPTLTAPADLATNVSEYPTFSWTAPTTGGVPTGYDLYLDTVDGSTLYAEGVSSPFTPNTPLDYETIYYWTVVAENAAGSGDPAAVRSFTTRANPTISSFPWTVDFSTWTPLNWTQLSGFYPTPTGTSAQWLQDDWLNVTTPVNKAAKINIYGSSRYGWLVTPPIDIPADGYEIKFDAALMTWNSLSTAVTPGEQADDKFMVIMSDSPSMSNPTVLREWNNTGSSWIFDEIPPAGGMYTIPLTGISGTKYFAFYGESTVSGGDNDLFVDNVVVREIPAGPIFGVDPADHDYGLVVINTPASQTFTMSNTGGGSVNVLSVSVSGDYFSLTEPFSPVSLGTGATATFMVNYLPTATGVHTGTVTITDGRAVTTIDLAGECYDPTITLFPWSEDFEEWPPLGWDLTGGTYSFVQYTDAATNNWARANFWGQPSGNTDIMTTPPLNPGAAVDLNFKWSHQYSSSYPNDALTVQVSSDMVNWEDLWYKAGTELDSADGAGSTAPGTGVIATVPIPSAYSLGTFFIRFYGYSGYGPDLFIDDVTVGPASTDPPEAVTLVSPANESTGLPIAGFDLSWTPAETGGIPTIYTIWMSQDESTIYDDLFFETTATTFNPVVDGELVFNYLDTWYWTVEAVNDYGSAVVDPPYWFEIEEEPMAIDTFPWTENFDSGLGAPTGWTVTDVDGAGTVWEVSTAQSHTSPNSFVHGYSTATPDPGQDGWLVTPPIAVPEGLNMVLGWWNYNVWPTYMVYNGVLVNTTPDPSDAGWVELWSQETAAAAWSQSVVNISAYGGQTVYFAFNYQGYDGDDWYIDDVSIYELLVDEIPPTITHLPLINTMDAVNSYVVTADIADDVTWNNPIGGANLYYSIDGGATWSAPVPMTLDRENYTAQIPAQALGTVVSYYIEAWDSENNMGTSATFAFEVNDPVWVWYDTGGTTWTWFGAAQPFSPIVLFENPLYGTGNALQLNTVDGLAYDVAAATSVNATLHVYTWDGVGGYADFVDLTGPIAVEFAHQAYETFDLSALNLQISTPFFLVSYDLPENAAFLYDNTYDYGTTYAIMDGVLYTMSNPGAWCIGANIQTGAALGLDTPMVNAELSGGLPTITWDAIDGASSYQVMGAATPDAEIWTLLATTANTSYTYDGTDAIKFFKVVADSEAAPLRHEINMNIRARSIRSENGPKTMINNIRR